MSDLSKALEQLDAAVAELRPNVAQELKPGLAGAALESVLDRLGPGCREELAAWFAWHNGQSGGKSLVPEISQLLIGAEECIQERELRETDEEYDQPPWPASWVPLLENGAGDYVVLETEGEHAGQLFEFWHAEEDYWEKPRAEFLLHTSLLDWAQASEAAVREG